MVLLLNVDHFIKYSIRKNYYVISKKEKKRKLTNYTVM